MQSSHHSSLRQASAYFRLAAKADRAGEHRQAEHYRKIAEARVSEHQRERAAAAQRRATR